MHKISILLLPVILSLWILWDRASHMGPYYMQDVLISAHKQSDRQPNWDQGTLNYDDLRRPSYTPFTP